MKRIATILASFLLFATTLFGQIDVNRVITIGQNAYYFHDYLVSISYFNQAIEIRPWMADPYFYRALAKFMLEDYKGAEKDASLALQRNAFISKAYLVKGLALRNQGDNKEAIKTLLKATQLFPSDSDLALNLIEVQLAEKETKASEKALLEFREKYPKNTYGLLLKSELELQKGDTISASKTLEESLKVDSTQAQTYASLALIHLQKKEYPSALKQLNKAIHYAPNEKSLFVNRGLARYHSKDYIGAIDDYTKAIEIDPYDPIAHFNRALLRATVGDNNNAFDDLAIVLKEKPNDYMALYNQGLVALDIGKYSIALKNFNKVLNRYPNFQQGLLARSKAKQLLGDIKGGERDHWKAYQQQKGRIKKTKKETRSKEEETIEQYNQLIETNKSSFAFQNNSLPQSLRGKIQNKKVAITPFDFFSLNYFVTTPESKKSVVPRSYFSNFITEYNSHHPSSQRLLIRPLGQALTAESIELLKERLLSLAKIEKKNTSDYLHLGLITLLLQDLEESENYLSKAIETDPNEAILYFARASVRKKMLEIKQSEHTSFKNQAKTIPSKDNTLAQKSPLRETSVPLRLRLIQEDLEKVLSLAPHFSYAYYNKALLLQQQGKLQEALENYNKAIEKSPIPEFFFNRGLLHLSLGNKELAEKDLSKAGERGIYQAYSIIKSIHK